MNMDRTNALLRAFRRTLAVGCTSGLVAVSSFAQGVPYGTGTRDSSGNVPLLESADAWIGNASFALTTSNAVGGSAALTLLSLDRSRIPLPGGSTLWIDPTLTAYLGAFGYALGGAVGVPGAGRGSLAIPIPANLSPQILGRPIYAQSFVLEPGIGGAVSSTAGLEIQVRLTDFVYVSALEPSSQFVYEYLLDRETVQPRWSSRPTYAVAEKLVAQSSGRALFSLGRSFLRRIDLTLGTPRWDVLEQCANCYDLEFDDARQILYMMDSAGAAGVQLVAIDTDPTSSRYGRRIASSGALAGSSSVLHLEELRSDGNEAYLADHQLGVLYRIGTDPSSATYMQLLQSYSVPLRPGATVSQVRVTPTNRTAWVVIADPRSAEIQRLNLSTGLWIDENPTLAGIQGIGRDALPPVPVPDEIRNLAIADSGTTALVAGYGGRSGSYARIDLIPSQPASFVWTTLALSVAPELVNTALELAPGSTVAYAAASVPGSFGSSRLYEIDVPRGQVTRSTEFRNIAWIVSIAVR